MTINATELNTEGLICPEPIMLLHKTIRQLECGQSVLMRATDPATTRDVPNFCRHLGHHLAQQYQDGETFCYIITKR